MELNDILNTENINIEQLQKGLKHIGLDLTRFDGIVSEQVPNLLELFKIALTIDPKSSKLTKMDLRAKLEKVIKFNSNTNNRPSSELKGLSVLGKIILPADNTNNLVENNKNRGYQNFEHLVLPQLASLNKKLGKVKFFDSKVNNFGILVSLNDSKECHVSPHNILTPPIIENDIVIYEERTNGKDKFKAINISKNIPVFIFNKESAKKSFAYPLLDNQLEKEIALTEKYETGFATVTAHFLASSWKTSIIPSEIIQKTESVSFSRAIIAKLLPSFNENKSTIEWLTSLLQMELTEAELNTIYSDQIINLEQKSVPEIIKEIVSINNIPFLKTYIKEKKKTLNKISFVLWNLGEIISLPYPSNQAEVDIWRFEILPSLDWQTLQGVLIKLLHEQGESKQILESYKYLINKGWNINSKEELSSIKLFLETFKTYFPSITFEETNFRCSANQFYIELYETGLIKELSETFTKQYIEELKTDDEKAGFIEKLPSDKILSYYFSFPSLYDYQARYVASILESEFSKIDFLCFDLESDGEKINEFAWKSGLGVKCEADFNKLEDGIAELVTLINSGSLIIGQNIKEFDLSVLANHGASPSSDFIWDTLEVEMLLNPERFSYGLKTQHNAKSDTELIPIIIII
jgi:hypothetical protein